jgi:site-specific DNA-methyltransferase (adenine-specific)
MNDHSVGEFVRIDKLQPHHKNPRHNDHAVDSIANSIKRFGFTSPIIANADQTIIAGHTRWKAAKRIGLETVPVVYVDLSPVDAELLMIADNKLGEKADWNTDQLSQLLTGLKEQGEDLDVLGFEQHELDELLEDLDADPFGDSEPEEDQEPEIVESDLDFRLLKGNCLDMLKELPDNSIDSIVTDPPYELGFMGKAWDSSGIAYSVELWAECLRVLKHGGHLVAFSGSRTVFPMGVAIAQAGFEVRDMISWIYTSGFPKSMNISIALDKQLANMPHRGIGVKHAVGQEHLAKPTKTEDLPPYVPASPQAQQWQGWGTALKPAQEPAVLARKPIDSDCSSIAENVLKWGTGAINIDAGRFPYGDDCHFGSGHDCSDQWDKPTIGSTQAFVYGEMGQRNLNQKNDISSYKPKGGRWPANVYQCKKPARSEKEAGLDHLTGKTGAEATQRKEGSDGLNSPRSGAGRTAEHVKNFHPTVKPIKLMRWLCRLLTPQGGTVLDPFLGSGTTAVSAILEGFNAVGCEMTEDYYPIIQGRVNWAKAERNREILDGKKEQTDG